SRLSLDRQGQRPLVQRRNIKVGFNEVGFNALPLDGHGPGTGLIERDLELAIAVTLPERDGIAIVQPQLELPRVLPPAVRPPFPRRSTRLNCRAQVDRRVGRLISDNLRTSRPEVRISKAELLAVTLPQGLSFHGRNATRTRLSRRGQANV